MVKNLPSRIYLQGSNGETDIENLNMFIETYAHGRGEERVRCVERVTRKLALACVKERASGNLLYVSGNSHRGSVST